MLLNEILLLLSSFARIHHSDMMERAISRNPVVHCFISLRSSKGWNEVVVKDGTVRLPYHKGSDHLSTLAGNRNYDSSATVYNQGNNSNYWSSSPNGSNARNLNLNTSNVNANNNNNRANGFSLRCFKHP
jgi:uncharacterized protein (TIGR02145 family)